MKINCNLNTKFLFLCIGISGILIGCVPDIEIIRLEITSPTKNQEISNTPLKIEGIIETTNQKAFLHQYTICIYKDIDGSLYWQKDNGNVTIIDKKWQGEIWLQERGFKNQEIQRNQQGKRFKNEGVKAIVCKKGEENQSKIPGYGDTSMPISSKPVVDDYFLNQLSNIEGQKESFTIPFRNLLPSQQLSNNDQK